MEATKLVRNVLRVLPLSLYAMSCLVMHGQTTAPPPPAAAATAPEAPAAASAAPASLVISAPAAAPEPAFLSKSKISVSGVLDGYYDYDHNDPDSGNTQIRNFDIRANTVSLTEAKITLAHDPGPVGIRVDLGLGSVFQVMHPANPSGTGLKYVEQMFVSAKPAKLKGFEADFGQFVTSAGAEVIESGDNWNYSRSYLFALAIPYYHFGLRTSMPVNSTTTVGVQVVQGWNNIFDNNSGKTVGITAIQSKKYYTLSGNYYFGPENNNTNKGYRNLFDTTLLLTPSNRVNVYLNYDYGQNRNANATGTSVADLVHWQGIAGAAHLQLTSKVTGTARVEYFADDNGFSTGTAQKLNEVTFTGDYLVHPGILFRTEYRHDHSDHQYFDYNHIPGSAKNQSTFEIGLIASFGPKT
jgi:hypothetical protein